ncbi:MAG: aminotransferase class I/II-fold pyridoxal phosphate-dependent enzyme, partial [Planctomycetales bacterium]|nr:aminotransferase class I/II-fold pyridoxal phosphate-dependent enzyme [Planctomycetales bacterium]
MPVTQQADTHRVPLIDLQAQWATIGPEVLEAVARVAAAGQLILGPEVEALEGELAEFIGCEHAIGVSSGTDALLVALTAVDVQPGDEVITTPFTFFSTASSIARRGARPVFVDIQPATFNLDPSQLAAALSDRTRAILPVHLFGQVAEMDPILQIARQHDLPVIEDAAQAIGATSHGRSAGCLGDIGCFSFYPTKNLGGLGDGGLVTTHRADLDQRLRLLRNHGFRPKYHAQEVGGNFRLDGIQAAALRVKLKYLPRWNEARAANAATYRQLLQDAGLSAQHPGEGKVVVPAAPAEGRHVYHQYVIRVAAAHRDRLRSHLA